MPLEDLLRTRHPAVQFLSERKLRALIQERIDSGDRLPLNTDLPVWHDGTLLLTPPDDRGLYDASESELLAVYKPLIDYAEHLKSKDASAWARLNAAQQREAQFVLESEERLPENATTDEVAITYTAWMKVLAVETIADHFPLTVAESKLEEPAFRSASSTPEFDPHRNYIRAIMAGDAASEAAFIAAVQARFGPLPLGDLIQAAKRSTWPHEKRALYDLQRLLADEAGPLDAVAPVEWLQSIGRQPLLRSLEPVRLIITQRRLRQIARHIALSDLTLDQRRPLEKAVDAVIEHHDHEIRTQYRSIFHAIFDRVGFIPRNTPEQIGRQACVEELLDRLSEIGFLRMADVRDAIARNHLKLPDIIHGSDPLLRADRAFSEALFGVYRRGEIYLRGIQRFSSLAFGTRLGRFLTLFVALPYGAAFVAIEGIKHAAHAVEKLLAWLDPQTVAIVEAEGHHPPALNTATLTALALLGTFLMLVINVPIVRAKTWDALCLVGRGLKSLLIDAPRAVFRSRWLRRVLNHPVIQAVNRYLLLPTIASLSLALTLILFNLPLDAAIASSGILFMLGVLFLLTPAGARFREELTESLHDMGRRVAWELIPGLINGTLWLFRETLGAMERVLYAIDEWFRYRRGQSKPSLALKVVLALVWFPISYVLRFAFYLLIEPQVNPIKHFPVVTVSHKVLLPLIPSLAKALNVSVETAGLIISGIPGVFGFLVWEFKENWKLYAANRLEHLPAAGIGHHGESVRGYLRPGFHSGTVPKLFRKLRRLDAAPRAQPRRRDQLDHERHHIIETLHRLVERHLIAYWQARGIDRPFATHIHLGVQRIEITIDDLFLSLEHDDGIIQGRINDWGWARSEERIINGFFATAAAGKMKWSDWLETTRQS